MEKTLEQRMQDVMMRLTQATSEQVQITYSVRNYLTGMQGSHLGIHIGHNCDISDPGESLEQLEQVALAKWKNGRDYRTEKVREEAKKLGFQLVPVS